MDDYEIIALFCHLDDFCQAHSCNGDRRQVMTNSEIILVALLASRMFSGNLSHARRFLKNKNYCPSMLSESRFNRRLHQIDEGIWLELTKSFSSGHEEYLVDSFPVPVCRAARGYRSHLFVSEEFRGYNASHKTWYFGLKVHLIVTAHGQPVSFIISPACEHDLTALKIMETPLPQGAKVYGDKAYTDYGFEEELQEKRGITLVAQRKKNSKRPHPEHVEKRRSKVRKMVETTISGIVRMMPRWIQAVTEKGFELKLTLFVIGFASRRLAS